MWWRHFGVDGALRLGELRRPDGSVAAVLPLYRWKQGPLAMLRFIGHGPGDQLGPVCDHGDVHEVARALRDGLKGGAWDCDGLLGDVLPGGEGWSDLEGAVTLNREATPVRSLDVPDWDTFLASLSSNHRQQVRRSERKLAKQHELAYRLSDDPARLDADMDVFFALHDQSWEGRSAAVDESSRGFYRDFAAEAQRAGWLRLWLLELDGEPAAAFLGFRFGGAELYYQLGRDRAFDKLAVGRVLLAHTIRAALEDGASEYRFLRGDEAYKFRFADRDPGLETIALPRSSLGRLAVGAVSLLRRSERGRRWVANRAD